MFQIGAITRLLQEAEEGKQDADSQLFVLVENDLRAIAHKRKQAAQAGHELSTTMLVHDAFLGLVGRNVTLWQPGDRRKFFGYASRKIQDMLIQEARRLGADKRGGGRVRLDLEAAEPAATLAADSAALLDLHEALDQFQQFAPDDALLFRMRFFLGCTFEEAAEVLQITLRQAQQAWERTRLWLNRQLKGYADDA